MVASLREHDPEAKIWILGLDDFTTEYWREAHEPGVEVIPLAQLEDYDQRLAAAKSSRSRIEYYFTLSPCWPRYLLQLHPEISRITYIDADMFWFSSPAPVLAEMGTASILITEHRHPPHLSHHQRYGRFNVGLLAFRNDETGNACLDWWRERCLEWCRDLLEDDKYADQKYLDEWPRLFGTAVHVCERPGVNLAPWNWSRYRYERKGDELLVDGQPIELFHFARFRPSRGTWWFQSGQLEYGVMPWALRQYLYGQYWRALEQSRERIRQLLPGFSFSPKSSRGWHQFWRAIVPRVIFGSDWLRIGPWFVSGRFGFGQFSGQLMSWTRSAMQQHVRRPVSAESRPPMEIPSAENVEAVNREPTEKKSLIHTHQP